jgi:sugar lactone lactonase YvrE
MPSIDPHDQRRGRWVSRRQILGASAGCLSLLLQGLASAEEEKPPHPRFLLAWRRRGKGNGEFSANVGLAIGTDDVIYTSEFRNQRVQKFTTEGKFLGTFPLQTNPGGLAVDPTGNVYVGFWNANKVAAHSPEGKLLREWGKKGTGDGEFQLPGSVAFGPDGLLYVPDQGNSRVQKFTPDGKFVGQFGGHGSRPGQFGGRQPVGGRFAGPQFVAFDRAGNVYTTDAGLNRVQKFTPEGRLLAHWGSAGADPGGFGPPPLDKNGQPITGGPIGICVDRQDRVWVSATNHRVQLFTNAGKYLCGLGLDATGKGPGHFRTPHALALDSRGCLYVADEMNSRVQKFAVD